MFDEQALAQLVEVDQRLAAQITRGPGELAAISAMASAGESIVIVTTSTPSIYRAAVMYCECMKLSIFTSTSGGVMP
jgi:hypothetical protein